MCVLGYEETNADDFGIESGLVESFIILMTQVVDIHTTQARQQSAHIDDRMSSK